MNEAELSSFSVSRNCWLSFLLPRPLSVNLFDLALRASPPPFLSVFSESMEGCQKGKEGERVKTFCHEIPLAHSKIERKRRGAPAARKNRRQTEINREKCCSCKSQEWSGREGEEEIVKRAQLSSSQNYVNRGMGERTSLFPAIPQ